jgi:hypothetical protein
MMKKLSVAAAIVPVLLASLTAASCALGSRTSTSAERTSTPAAGTSTRAAATSTPASATSARAAATFTPRVATSTRPVATSTLSARVAARNCFGAAALAVAGACPATRSGTLTPTTAKAPTDFSAAYHGNSGGSCFASQPTFPLVVCRFGDPSARVKVALVGNSHAGQWLPALQVAARAHGWRIVTFLASRCAYSETRQRFDQSAEQAACRTWVQRVTSRLVSGGFALIVMSNRISVPAVGASSLRDSYSAYLRGYTAVLSKLHAAHRRVYAIRDTPAPGFAVPACLAAHRTNYLACSGARSKWLPREPVYRAATAVKDRRIRAGSFMNYICTSTRCAAAVGGVIVYRDPTHLTATYNRTIGPYVSRRLHDFMAATG